MNLKIDILSTNKKNCEKNLSREYALQAKGLEQITQFYASKKRLWSEEEFDQEDAKKYFKDKILSKLSIKDYSLLWSKFPTGVQTHSVRQGIRDHVGEYMDFGAHNIGEKKYFNNFKEIIASGHLKNTLDVMFPEGVNDETINAFLQNENQYKTRESKISFLKQMLRGFHGHWEDRTAIHFGTNLVLDEFYGSETDNEIFIAFPAIYIAANHNFAGNLSFGIDNMAGNDTYVWSNNKKGIPLDSGIVFIPKNSSVDKDNGSQYLLNENLEPIFDKEGNLQPAKNTISSEEYWNNYFKSNPSLEPARVVYYEEKSATAALNSFQQINQYEDFDYAKEFSENARDINEYRDNAGRKKLKDTLDKIL